MDHERLKREFGERLSFHGGIDLQHVLPFGTPEEVYNEAVKTMRLWVGRWLYLAPTITHPDVPRRMCWRYATPCWNAVATRCVERSYRL